jgi:hypothetical protein
LRKIPIKEEIMKVLCKKSLYWHQNPGYSGYLMTYPAFAGVKGKLVLEKGKKYEIFAVPVEKHLEYITLCAVGEDGKAYIILHDELHVGRTKQALEHFAFREAFKDLEIAR